MALIFIETERGYAISDIGVVAALLSRGARHGGRWLCEPKKIPAIQLKGWDGKKDIRILETDWKEATKKIRDWKYNIEGIILPQGRPMLVFEVIPGEEQDQETLKKWIDAWHTGRLEVNAKKFNEYRRDLVVLAHHTEVVDTKELPKEWKIGGEDE